MAAREESTGMDVDISHQPLAASRFLFFSIVDASPPIITVGELTHVCRFVT
jgi:hypothetical protein